MHAVFALFNAYFTGAFAVRGGRWGIKRKTIPSIVVMRLVVALLLLLAPVTELALFIWERGVHHSLSQLTYLVVASMAWFSHVIYLLNISRSIRFVGRGPILLNFSWYLTFVSVVLLFWLQVQHSSSPSGVLFFEVFYFAVMPRSFAIATFSLHVVYCLCLLIPAPDAVSVDQLDIPPTQLWDGSTQNRGDTNTNDPEKEYLLRSTNGLSSPLRQPAIESYGSISIRKLARKNKKKQEEVTEDSANFLSKLTFWWFQPLMSKGARGDIEGVKDLPFLPWFLHTSFVREHFREIWQKTVSKGLPVQTVAENANVQGEIPRGSPCYPEQSDSTGIPPTPGKNESRDELKHITWKNMTLFRSLNRAFGCQYYSLGLLKLLVNALSFAGPVLLQYLVNFMENKVCVCVCVCVCSCMCIRMYLFPHTYMCMVLPLCIHVYLCV